MRKTHPLKERQGRQLGERGDGGSANHLPHGLSKATALMQGKPVRLQSREVLYRENEPADCVYVVRGGMVKLLSHLPNGRARIVRLHARGGWVGLEGLLGDSYEHTAMTVGDVAAERYFVDDLRRLGELDPTTIQDLLQLWHDELMNADKWIAEFSTGTVMSRVARLIEYLAELEHGDYSGEVELLTVHEMAEILGVTPESVSRIVAGMKRREVLRRQPQRGGEFYHVDRALLQGHLLD